MIIPLTILQEAKLYSQMRYKFQNWEVGDIVSALEKDFGENLNKTIIIQTFKEIKGISLEVAKEIVDNYLKNLPQEPIKDTFGV